MECQKWINRFYITVSFLCLIFYSLLNFAMNDNPVDLWCTYDLNEQPKSIVKFYKINNELRADVVKSLNQKDAICKPDLEDNNPGKTIIWGLRSQNNKWVGGFVFDSKSGKTYNCQMMLSKDGQTMDLYVFKGSTLFGRTLKWRRLNQPR